MLVLAAITFFLVLSLLVMIHEFGHFLAARLAGISAVEFALGLPFTKPLWKKRLKGGLQLSFYPLLFGGFVRLLGEEGEVSKTDKVIATKGKEFYKAPVGARIGVVVAGVIMNAILAIGAFYLFLSLSGFRVMLPKLAESTFISSYETRIVVSGVQPGSPADSAKIVTGDMLVRADGKKFTSVSEFQNYIKSRVEQPVTLVFEKLDFTGEKTAVVTPRSNPPVNEGALGVGIGDAYEIKFETPAQRALSGVTFSIDTLVYNISVISHFVTMAKESGDVGPVTDTVSGPIFIFKLIEEILGLGGIQSVIVLINLVGVLSLSLAFMNILPIPAFDGGRLVFLLIEALTKRRVPAKIENFINQGGMVLVLLLIVVISYNDITKIIRK